MHDEDNDGKFPDESPVLPVPLGSQHDLYLRAWIRLRRDWVAALGLSRLAPHGPIPRDWELAGWSNPDMTSFLS
jgi:hypothetical protein